jgi:hypothetical protein
LKTLRNILTAIAIFIAIKMIFAVSGQMAINSALPLKHDLKQSDSLVETTSQQATPTDGFERLSLSDGLQIDVPLQWEPLPKEITTAIQTTANALMSNEGIDTRSDGSRLLLAYTSRPTTTYASVRIKEIMPASISPAELLAASNAEVTAVAQEWVQLMSGAMIKQKQDFQPGAKTTRELVSGHPALVFRYRRLGEGGIVAVEQIRIMTSNREVSVTLSYREAEELLWRPVIENIRRSIVVPT